MKKLNIDGITLRLLLPLYKELFIPNKIQKIKQVSKDLLFLKVYPLNKYLVLSVIPGLNSIFPYSSSEDSPKMPFAFQMLLRKHISGAIIMSIEQFELDRTIIIGLKRRDDFYKIIINLYGGAGSNILLCDNSLKILGDIRSFHTPDSIYRFISDKRLNPMLIGPDGGSDPSEITHKYQGFSREHAKEFSKSGVSFKDFIKEIDFSHERITEINQTFIEYRKQNTLSHLRNSILSKIRTKTKIVEKKLRSIDNGIRINSEYKEKNKIASLLLNHNEKNIKKDKIVLKDWESNIEITYNLRPELTIMENSSRLFKKSKRMKKELERLLSLKIELEKEPKRLSELNEKAALSEISELKEIEQLLDKKRKKRRTAEKKENKNKYFYIIPTPKGRRLCIAKSSSSSEILTFRTAKSNDIFFHVEDAPGAHTVLMLKNKNDIPEEEELIFSAKEAARHSKLKNSTKVRVCYTKIKDVKKIPGKYSGKVILRTKKTLFVTL